MTSHLDNLKAQLADAQESYSWTAQKYRMDRGLPGRGSALKAAMTRTSNKIAVLKAQIARAERRAQ